MRGLLGLCTALAGIAPAAAQQQVIIEGRRHAEIHADAERRAAIGLLTVIDREELEAFGDASVLDLLARQPGIGLDGDQPRLRAMGAGYTLVLLDGEPAPPGFNLDSLNPADIERIEIVKGSTAEFGGAAGTINVILRRAPATRQREARATLAARDSGPQATTSLTWGDQFKPRPDVPGVPAFGWHLPITLHHRDERSRYHTERVGRDRAGTVSRQAVQGHDDTIGRGATFSPRMDLKPDALDTLQLQGFFQFNENEQRTRRATTPLQGPQPWSVLDENAQRNQWETARLQAQWHRRQPDGQRLELRASLQSSLWRQQGESQATAPDGALREPGASLGRQREQRASAAARWRLPLGQAHTLTLGADVEERRRRELRRQFRGGVEQFGGSLGLPSTGGGASTTLFVQDEWVPAPGWALSLGLRATEAKLDSIGPEGEVRRRHFSWLPVASVRRALDPAGRSAVRASVARGQRVPDATLLLPRYVLNGQYDRDSLNTPIAADTAGNPRLRPEHTSNIELAWERQAGPGMLWSVGLSHRRIADLIRRGLALETVPEATVPRWVSRPVNLGRAHSTALELEWKQRAAPGLDLRAGLSLVRSSVEQIDAPDARLEGQAPWALTLGLQQALAATKLSWGASLVLGPDFSVQQSDRQRVTRSGQRKLDAFLLWRHSRALQLRLAAANLLAPDNKNASSVADLDGFAARAATRRSTQAQLSANLVLRF